MRKFALLGALTLALLGSIAPGASAETWKGDCDFKGAGDFHPATTYEVTSRDFLIRGKGTCRGALNGKRYRGPASIFIDGRMHAPMSCEFGITLTDQVPGTLTFGSRPNRRGAKRLDLLVPNVHTFSYDVFFMQGAYNGEAIAKWVLDTNLDTVVDCLPTRGVPRLTFTMDLHTIRQLYG
jgi:hypothetical protein